MVLLDNETDEKEWVFVTKIKRTVVFCCIKLILPPDFRVGA